MKIPICVACDEHQAKYVPVLLNSVVKNTDADIRVTVLSRGISEADREAIRRVADSRFVDMTEVSYGNPKLLKHTTVSTMDRLFIPDIVEYDKVIYLDVDTIVDADIAELYAVDTSDKGLAAKTSSMRGYRTTAEICERQPRAVEMLRAAQIKPDSQSFNAGVLVMDLDKLWKNDFTDITTGYVERFGINDQIAISLYANGDFVEIPVAWNVFVRQEDPEEKKLYHWAGPYKPWDAEEVPFADVWKKYIPRST